MSSKELSKTKEDKQDKRKRKEKGQAKQKEERKQQKQKKEEKKSREARKEKKKKKRSKDNLVEGSSEKKREQREKKRDRRKGLASQDGDAFVAKRQKVPSPSPVQIQTITSLLALPAPPMHTSESKNDSNPDSDSDSSVSESEKLMQERFSWAVTAASATAPSSQMSSASGASRVALEKRMNPFVASTQALERLHHHISETLQFASPASRPDSKGNNSDGSSEEDEILLFRDAVLSSHQIQVQAVGNRKSSDSSSSDGEDEEEMRKLHEVLRNVPDYQASLARC